MIEITGSPTADPAPISPAPTAPAATGQDLPEYPKKNNKIWLWLFGVILLVATGVGAYWWGQNSSDNLPIGLGKEEELTELEQVEELTYDRTELLYTKFFEDVTGGGLPRFEAWLLDLDTKQKKQLDLPNLAAAFKHPQNSKVFYTELNNENTLLVRDILTGEVKRYEVINHPNPEVREGVTISGLGGISPDGSMVIYNVFFTEPCPPIDFDSLPPGFEGGFGPCEPELDPNLPAGYYLYDLTNKTNTYLGGVVLPSTNWDLANNKLYFNDIDANQGLKVLDLKSKQFSIFDRAKTFGYGAFPMLKSNFLVKIEGQTGDVAGQESNSTLSLVNLTDQTKKILDSGRWANIQPFATIAPDESKFLYMKTSLDGQGRGLNSLHMYDLQTANLRQVTPTSTVSSYSIYGYWPDNEHFITTVNETGADFNSYKNYLVSLNVQDGSVIKLVDDAVYRFLEN
jgi:hypothetical protein